MTSTAGTVSKVNKEQTNYIPSEVVKETSYGRWQKEILPYFGIAQEFLIIGKNCPCPACGGHDRYRFEDRNKKTSLLDGSYFCRHCGSGDGINLVAKLHYGGDNRLAFKAISAYLGTNNSLSPLQISQLSQCIKEAKAKAIAKQKEELKERVRKREEVAKHAKAIIDNCTIQSNHPYLESKNLPYQVLVNKKNYIVDFKRQNQVTGKYEDRKQLIKAGYLIIPLYDVNSPDKLLSVQFIYFNENKQKWDKRPIAGTQISDCIHVIKGESTKPYCQIVEGWATGVSASISTGFTTIMAIDANGMASKAEKIKALYPDRQMLFLADNDIRKGHKRGEKAAHTASIRVNGVVVTPIEAGDWDDYRHDYGEDNLCAEINHQITELSFKPVEIKPSIIGISINSSVLLASGDGVSFAEALINHSGKQCTCPISGEKAIINAGYIYCYETKHIITPIIANLYNVELIAKYKKLTSTKKRIKELHYNPNPKNVYAFTIALSHRIGADIPALSFKNWLHSKSKVMASDEIASFVKCLSRARINQSKILIALDPKQFKHRLYLKQKNGLLDWSSAVNAAKKGGYKMVCVKAQHGQGKSQDFMKQMFAHAVGLGGATAIAHRTKLVTQLADVLKCIHYQDDREYIFYAGTVKDLACCLHSFKHEKFLNHLVNSHSIFIDEASQALKTFYTDKHIEEKLSKKFSQATKEAQCIYLLDADLTENDIHRWTKLLEVNEDEILVITAEPPIRDFTVNLSCTASQKYFKSVLSARLCDIQQIIN